MAAWSQRDIVQMMLKRLCRRGWHGRSLQACRQGDMRFSIWSIPMGGAVGYVWIGPDATDDSGAWRVWSVVIDDDKCGRGFGRAAMHLAEEYARARGAASIGVQVFGDRTSSRVLYESLGYSAVSVKMRKILSWLPV